MERVLAELTETGLLDEDTVRWVRETCSERGGSLDTALLELDVVDEETLLRALSAHHGIAPASTDQLHQVDHDLADRLALDVSVRFGLCPIRFEDYGVVVWVESPLEADRLEELHQAVGLETHQRIAPAHLVAAARERVYGAALDDRHAALETRLARRRAGVDLPTTLDAIANASTLADAVTAAADFAADHFEISTFFIEDDDAMHVVGLRGAVLERSWVAKPGPQCTFAAALRYGGYFLGPVMDSDADQDFFASLSRPLARRAFVAPLPTPDGPSVVFFGENGPRAISARLAAEVSLVAARLAQRGESWAALRPETVDVVPVPVPVPVPAPAPALEPAPKPEPAPAPEPTITPGELGVLARLRTAAAAAGQDLPTFVDQLLRAAAVPAPAAPSAALAGEVKELFERLATDIPTQLARGMEAAFRDLAPRISAGAAPAAAAPVAARPSAAASVDLVMKKDAGPREVPSYRARRAKSKRRKL